MNIKIQALETFVAVAESGNLVDAAERLHRTPSAVSMALKQLESHFGRRLFESDRKAQLTPIGRFLLEHARRELEHFEHTVRTMERYARGETGAVRLACVPSVATRLLPAVLRRFREQHTGVDVDVRDMDSESVCDALHLGRIDLGLASPVARSEGFLTSPLTRDALGVVCSAGHPLTRHSGPLSWCDLTGFEFIANGACRHIDDPWMRRLLADAALMVRNTTSLLALVAADAGITVLPRMAVDERDPGVRFRLLECPVRFRELVVLRRAGVTPTPALEAFEAVLITVAADLDADPGSPRESKSGAAP